MSLILRPYQRAAVDGLYEYWNEGGGNGLIVVPTGGGKSAINATICRELLSQYRDLRIGCVTHVKELISQNAQELIGLWNQAPVGIYSAGLGRRDQQSRILFMGIQSVYNKVGLLGDFDLIIVDEAHLIPRDTNTRYGKFFAAARKRVPDMRIIGLTATPYRLDSGRLDKGDDRLFDDVVYDCSVRDLIRDGYLSPLISPVTLAQIDTSKVHVRGGEFVERELADAAMDIVDAAVAEIVEKGQERQGWLIFAVNVAHAEQVVKAVKDRGISCEMVVGTTPKGERDSIINRFKRRQIRCLVSVGVLTTGFNAPHVDLIALLRSTLSTGLYVQMVGRGFRLAHGKDNCLVLDFGGNVRRHGPVDDVSPRGAGMKRDREEDEEEGKAAKDEVRAKECPQCDQIVGLGVTMCPHCGHIWPDEAPRHDAHAEQVAILSTENTPPEWIEINDVRFSIHEKEGSPPSLRATFYFGLAESVRTFLCFGHQGYARRKALQFWSEAGGGPQQPANAEEALARSHELTHPSAVLVKRAGRWPDVIGYRWPERSEAAE